MYWASRVAQLTQVSLIGYAVGGLFLGLAYFDLPYHLMAIMILTKEYVRRELKLPGPLPELRVDDALAKPVSGAGSGSVAQNVPARSTRKYPTRTRVQDVATIW